jgi:hypothetical protein
MFNSIYTISPVTNRRRFVPIVRYKRIIGKTFKRNNTPWPKSVIHGYEFGDNLSVTRIYRHKKFSSYVVNGNELISHYYLRKYYEEV